DNFEHLAADAPIINTLLDACPQLKVLVTSRVRLGVPHEWLLPLDGLPYPDLEDQDNIEAFDAVRLFVQSAHRVEPMLVPSVDAASIVDICQLVEGLPLALQLAAAWTRLLSCEAIAAELRHGTELLQATDPAHPRRHASIENVFDQSWRLLGPVERGAFARLSIFRGGFTADAARAVAAASLPVLGALTDKSLLRKDGSRLLIHPLIHQLAALRLSVDEREATERAHALYFHRTLTQLKRQIELGERDALRGVDIELDNHRAAWSWSIKHEDADTLFGSTVTLLKFFDHSGRASEGIELLRAAVETSFVPANAKLNALLLGAIALLEFRFDRYEQAIATATKAREAAKLARYPDAHALSLQVLGSCSLRLVRYKDALDFFKDGVKQAKAAEDPRKVNTMLHNSALVQKLMGDQDGALRTFMDSLTRDRAHGDFVGEAITLANIGLVCAEKGDLESAISHMKAGLVICDRHGFAGTRLLILTNLMGICIKANDLAAAEQYGRIALEVAEATNNRHVIASLKMHFSRLALHRGDLPGARSSIENSLRIAVEVRRPSLLLQAISHFADILVAKGDADCARVILQFLADNPLRTAPEKSEDMRRLAQWKHDADEELTWPGMDASELAHRIVTESGVAYAPLISTLRRHARSTHLQ
ncbi:MAG TPA: hypothetical protein VM937_03955, partial [Burkholderiaceae bacterium]|nr:hypothetical protein [Burkholderiaceae bacterium]